MDLTKKQQAIFNFLKDYIAEHQYPPSVRDIASHFDLSSAGGVHKHLINLEEKGYISVDKNQSRSIRILKDEGGAITPSIPVIELPLLGEVAAGQPIERLLDNETFPVPESMLRWPERSYVLKVRGDSMIEEAILDGDFVLVEDRNYADNGDLVIAMINYKEATLKRFFKEGTSIRLQPSNLNMEPIRVPAADVSIQGIVRGIFRRY